MTESLKSSRKKIFLVFNLVMSVRQNEIKHCKKIFKNEVLINSTPIYNNFVKCRYNVPNTFLAGFNLSNTNIIFPKHVRTEPILSLLSVKEHLKKKVTRYQQ